MRYMVTADTDVGISKNNNQDSICIKHANTPLGEIVMAIICDGMGGLAKGELASATVIRVFSDWFHSELPYELPGLNMQIIGEKWDKMLKNLNFQISNYGKRYGASLGTTFSGILMINQQYVIAHVGDSRIYHISSALQQITEDQSVVGREVRRGNLTPEQAEKDSRRNILLQCIGASKVVTPQILYGTAQPGAYMICSDGFRHEISSSEIYQSFHPTNLTDQETMHNRTKYLINLVKSRKEKDNISVVLIKAD